MHICQFCNRETFSKKSNGIHQARCPKNPNRFKQIPWNIGTVGIVKSWNKGMTGLKGHPVSDKTKKRLSEVAKERKLGGYIRGSGRGKKGWYKGYFCDSSWELAYVIYCLDYGISIKRNTEKYPYEWKNKIKNYIPDFIVENQLVEIKGYKTKEFEAKIQNRSFIKVLYQKDLKEIFKYVIEIYGKDYIRLYEQRKNNPKDSG